MKSWVQPLATVQKFVANEYVAACWGVACVFPFSEGNNHNNKYDTNGGWHQGTRCGDPTHYIIKTDENDVPYQMIETQTQQGVDYECILYTDGSYTARRDIATVTKNETLYWTTTGDQNGREMTWLHYGSVQQTTNHS